MAKNLIGEILINTTTVELIIYNTNSNTVVESVHKNMQGGSDIYSSGSVPFSVARRLLVIMQGYRQLMADYDVQNVQVWASELFMQAANSEFIADQIKQATGYLVKSLNSSQEEFYRNQAIRTYFPKFAKMAADNLYIIGINSGRLDIGYYNKSEFQFSRSLLLGPIRIAESLEEIESQIVDYPQFLTDFIGSKIADFAQVLPQLEPCQNLLVTGSDILNKFFIPVDAASATINITEFNTLKRKIQHLSRQELIEQFGVQPEIVRYIMPEIFILERAFSIIHAQTITLTRLAAIDGLIFAQPDAKLPGESEIIASAENIADQYRVEYNHRKQVETFALHIFDQLKPVHHLGHRERLLLDVVCIVHDIGNFVNSYAHYIHSAKLIQSLDFHGLSDKEQAIIAMVSQFHSSKTPVAGEYQSEAERFNKKERLLIAKLTAILRIADALDDSRLQKIKTISVSLRETEVVITATTPANILLEAWTFEQKSAFFMDVFGIQATLKKRVSRK
ncbi:hypothetical protein KAR50_00995 [Periweissella fabaria]|uniref:Guanosine-5'-triphosphate,3'-diphosphate pyrophosphatase n=1 Tax=Periweissella fabaria TaxID=546157 RepID=A0ABN8BJ08_9LACO|nr:hypothetical protein [Periweissella fabaria]MCM0596422.1 hypothetical protein [Periweissella fabaria]CAH0415850.1 Guanosine-5'-triphosphate,3'-diphosphate pyrophosphatase [Periweissella fabaria]